MRDINQIQVNINFDIRLVYAFCFVDDTINLWVSTLFNLDEYQTTIDTDLPFVKVSDYQYQITPDEIGWHKVGVSLVSKRDVTRESISNTLLIISKNKLITADSDIITADSDMVLASGLKL